MNKLECKKTLLCLLNVNKTRKINLKLFSHMNSRQRFKELGPDMVWSCSFTHVSHNKRWSLSDMFWPTLFVLVEGWGLGSGWRRQDMMQNVRCGDHSVFLKAHRVIIWFFLKTSKSFAILWICQTISVQLYTSDVGDHCAVAMIRNCKLRKTTPRTVERRHFKTFDQQAFLHDVYHCDWHRIFLIPEVELVWTYFKDLLLGVLNKHSPWRRFRVRGRDKLMSDTRQRSYLGKGKKIWFRKG